MMAPNGPKTVGGVGDVALRHFKELRGFEQYKQYYVQREEALAIVAREKAKRGSPFAAYIDVRTISAPVLIVTNRSFREYSSNVQIPRTEWVLVS